MFSKTHLTKVFILVLVGMLLIPQSLTMAGPNPPPTGDASFIDQNPQITEMRSQPLFTSVQEARHSSTTSGGDVVVTPRLITATLNAGQTHNAQIQISIGEAPVGRGDVMFVIDRTGSMGDEISQVKTSAVQIMNDIRSQLPFAWFGVGSFMDYPGYFSYPGYSDWYGSAASGDVPWELNIALTDNTTDVANTINGLWLGYGGDWPECYTRALFEASQIETVGWRTGAKRVIVLFGDAPTHDLTFAGYNFGGDPGRDGIAQTEDDLVFVDIVQQLRDEGISIVAVNSGYNLESEATFKGMSIGYAESPGTNGRYFQLANASEIPTAVTQLIISETQQIDRLWLQVTKGYEGWVQIIPEEYTDVDANTTKTFDLAITVPAGTASGFYPFLIQAMGDGAILGLTYVEVTVPASSPISDLGFRPSPNGFRFANESSEQTWQMFKQFFGTEQVEWPNGNRIHVAEAFYREHYRNAGDGGSCDGFSATSLINYKNLSQPNAGDFAMSHYSSLYSQKKNNDIADAYAFSQGIQMGLEIQAHQQWMCELIDNSPRAFYQYLKSQIQNNSGAVLGIRWKDIKVLGVTVLPAGAHALVPYRYEEPSDDKAYIYVYDSNSPGDNDRRVEFDLTNNKWKYVAFNLWFIPIITLEGDNSWCNLAVTPIEMYRRQGVAWWAQSGWGAMHSSQVQTNSTQLLTTSGPARLLITDDQGRRLGWDEADFYDEIPGASYASIARSISGEGSGFYYVPSDVHYTLQAHGYGEGQADVSVFSEGYLVQLSSWEVITGTTVALDVSANGNAFAISGIAGNTRASLTIGQILSAEDRTVTINDLNIGTGQTVNLQFEASDTAGFTDTIKISTNSVTTATYGLSLHRAGGTGYSSFGHADVVLDANSVALININDWNNLAIVTVLVDLNGDGAIDEARSLDNQASINSISLEASRDTAYTGGEQVNIIVEVRDQFGAYIADGQVISFSTNLGTLSSETGVTEGGLVYLTLTTGSEEGVALVTAQSEGVEGIVAITIVSHRVYLPLVLK